MHSFTDLQGQYLAYIATYTTLHRRPPAEADLQEYFRVSPPAVHRMVVVLTERGLIRRQPGAPRSIEVLVPPDHLPPLRSTDQNSCDEAPARRRMRRTDRDRLGRSYGRPSDSPTPGPAGAPGVEAPQMQPLEDAIFADFSAGPPFGIGWWAPGPGTTRRVLIGDQLFACATSTRENLVEASLHGLEFLDYAEQESDMFADAVQVERGELVVRAPRRASPIDDIVLEMSDLHLLGVARALSGALDCLAGVIIGVVGLRANILRADFGSPRTRSTRCSPVSEVPREGPERQARGHRNGQADGLPPEPVTQTWWRQSEASRELRLSPSTADRA